jgi:hypothetical protein
MAMQVLGRVAVVDAGSRIMSMGEMGQELLENRSGPHLYSWRRLLTLLSENRCDEEDRVGDDSEGMLTSTPSLGLPPFSFCPEERG